MPAAGDQIDAGAGAALSRAEVARFDQQAAAFGQRELARRFAGGVAAAGVTELRVAHRHRTLRAQDDVGGLALFLDFAFVDHRRAQRLGGEGARCAAVEAQAAIVRSVAAATLDHHRQRVEQQHTVATTRRRGVGTSAIEQGDLARHLDLAAIAAALAAARPDVAVEGGGLIGPHDHLAAVALEQRVGQQAGAAAYPAHLGVAYLRIGALPVAADQHRASAGVARGIQRGRAADQHGVGGDFDLTALADRLDRGRDRRRAGRGRGQFDVLGRACRGRCRSGSRGQRAGGAQRAVDACLLRGGDIDAAALGAAGLHQRAGLDLHLRCGDVDIAAGAVGGLCRRFRLCGKRDRLRSAQHDAAVGGAVGTSGADLAGLGQRRPEHADVAATGDQLTEVDRLAACFDAYPQRRLMRIGDFDALAGGEHDVAVVGGDQTGVLDIGGDQQQRAAGGLQRAFVAQLAGRAFGVELQPPGGEVLVADVQCRGDQPRGVDLGACAEQHAVRVDQEHAPVGDQIAQYLRRILPDHAVEYGGGRVRLDEAGGFARLDGELLPVDDGAVAGRDVQRVALGLDADLALHDLVPGRIGDDQAGQRCRHGSNQSAQCATAAVLAARTGFFRHRHIAAVFVGVNQSVATLVHFGLKFC